MDRSRGPVRMSCMNTEGSKYWLAATEAGRRRLHDAALQGGLEQVPAEVMTPENLALRDDTSKTPLDYASASDNLDQIPLETLKACLESADRSRIPEETRRAVELSVVRRLPAGDLSDI
jgi:hypothetical protein